LGIIKNKYMKRINKSVIVPYILLVLSLIYIFLYKSCNNNIKSQTKIITISPKDGTFVKTKPTEFKYNAIIRDTIVYKDKKIIIDNTDKKIVNDYLKAKDSIAKLNIVINSAKIRRYKNKLEDDNIVIDIESETTGTLNWIKPSYKIKEQKLPVPVLTKNTVFALYVGGGISNNLQFNNFALEGNIGIQNKKGDIISVGYDTQKNISLKYSVRLINIKK
jgi:hypothetical protein